MTREPIAVEEQEDANVYRFATVGRADCGNFDSDDSAALELHRRHLSDRNRDFGPYSDVTKGNGSVAIIPVERRIQRC